MSNKFLVLYLIAKSTTIEFYLPCSIAIFTAFVLQFQKFENNIL